MRIPLVSFRGKKARAAHAAGLDGPYLRAGPLLSFLCLPSARLVRRATILVLLTALSGCAAESRVTKYRPIMADLPGAQVGADVVAGGGTSAETSSFNTTPDYFVEEEDGTLIAQVPTGAYLVYHINKAVRDDDQELFVTQLLSKKTRRELIARGLTTDVAWRELVQRKRDLIALFRRMPQGEFTPGLRLEMTGPKLARIRVGGETGASFAWDGMDMAYEDGGWRLVWFTLGRGSAAAK